MNPTTLFDRFRLDGRTAIITGIGPGIGSHVAQAYAAAGANVVLVARTAEKVEALANSINAAGGHALAVPADVGKKEDVQRLVAAARERFGVVDLLFNNAAGGGEAGQKDIFETDDAIWEVCVAVNLLAPFRLAKALVPDMRRKGSGSIINVLTTTAFRPVEPYVAYGSTKAGLMMLTRYLAKACAPEVRVNAICPGTISPEGVVWETFGPVIDHVPMKRPGKPDEVVGAALLLASDAASYMSGQVLFVDGGRVATVS